MWGAWRAEVDSLKEQHAAKLEMALMSQSLSLTQCADAQKKIDELEQQNKGHAPGYLMPGTFWGKL